MSGDDIGRLVYLSLLGAVIASWFFLQNRGSLNKIMQQAAVWALIFIGAIAVAGLWSDIRQTVNPSLASFSAEGEIIVPRGPDGHYYLTLEINDAAVRFVIDTGATDMVLTKKDAERVGLVIDDLAFVGRAMTANGEVRVAPVWLDKVTLGPISDANVPASVNSGEMGISLLGMSYLQRFERIEISGGQLVLTR